MINEEFKRFKLVINGTHILPYSLMEDAISNYNSMLSGDLNGWIKTAFITFTTSHTFHIHVLKGTMDVVTSFSPKKRLIQRGIRRVPRLYNES